MTGWILLNAALKGTIVLGAAWLVTWMLRRKSAAARHLVWTAAAAAVLAIPFLSVGLPALRLPARAADLVAASGVVFRVFITVAPEAPAPAIPAALPAPAVSQGGSAPIGIGWLVWVWAIGAAAILLQMAIAYGAMWRKRRAARRFDDRGLTAALGIHAPVELLEDRPGSMPMVFGLLRPAIFLPADAVEWAEDRLRMVLLHELAHVHRGDLATHLLARTALSLHWWNPLAWIAWREFVKERERAADDLVLGAGARASDYAGHLLAVARSMQSSPVTASAAVAMARRSQLEGRLLAILDGGVARGPVKRYAPLAAALLAVAIVAPFAALQAQNRPALPEIDATIRVANSQKNHDILDHAARAYMDLYKFETAQTLLETALTIRGEVAGQQSASYAAGLVKLGDLAVKRRQFDEADLFYAKAVSLGDRPEVAPALLYLGVKAYGMKNREAGWDFLQRTIKVDPSGPMAGRAYLHQAMMRRNEPDAEILYQHALSRLGSDEPETATALEMYSVYLKRLNRLAEAEQAASRAAQIRKARNTDQVQLSGKVVRIGAGVTAPEVMYKVEPEYAEEARAAKFQGTVLLNIEVTPEGKAQNIKVARSLGLGLDEKAIEAVSLWRFRPGMDQTGKPVTVAATIEINFRLQ